jgi:hypothetical protein
VVLVSAVSPSRQVTIFIRRPALVTIRRPALVTIRRPALVTAEGGSSPQGMRSGCRDRRKPNVVSFASAASAARLSEFLQARGKTSKVLSSVTSKFDDLQRGPAVLLGSLKNAWCQIPN